MLAVANLLFSAMLVLVGGSIASFWALVAYRQTCRVSWVKGRSRCDHCRHQICWWENIPVLSYILLGGRCHHCRRSIPPLYFWWEVLLGAWTLAWFYLACPLARYFDVHNLAVGMIPLTELIGGWWSVAASVCLWFLGSVLLWTALVDMQTHTIASGWLWAAAAITFVRVVGDVATGALAVHQLWTRLTGSVAIVVVFMLINWLSQKVWHKAGIGSGDMILVGILAWWLSSGELLAMFLLSFWIGALVCVFLLVVSRHYKLETAVAFLPFINVSFLLAYFWGQVMFEFLFG